MSDRKPADRRQGKSTHDLEVVGPLEVPAARDSWPASVKDGWVAAWESPQAGGWSAELWPVLFRLFDLRAKLEALDLVWSADPIVEGSVGQLTVHPSFKMAEGLRTECRMLEDRLGLNLKSKVGLGVKVVEVESKSLEGRAAAARRKVVDPRR